MVKQYFTLCIGLLAFSITSYAQVEDESCLPPSKKVVKMIDNARNSADAKTAITGFLEAIEAAPDNAMPYYEYAMYAYQQGVKYYETQPNPAMGDKSFTKAEEMFRKALEFCSDYHGNCTYYLGVINYSQKQMEDAISYFKQFLKYEHTEPSRYPEDFDKKQADVKEVLAELESEQELLSNSVPFDPKMVPNVSSKEDEYFPMISPDNEMMFYTRKLDRKTLGSIQSNVVEEFTFSQRNDMRSPFDAGNPFAAPFNDGSFISYGAATLSVDNKEMIFCACNDGEVRGQKYRNCDLYITHYERSGTGGNDFQWSELKNLGGGINTPDGWEGQPSLSADGNTLYYTANRPSTRDNDIFVATRDPKGNWSAGRPFDEINTDGKDKSPFLHQDSETLYFVSTVSDTRKGVGGTDIFYSRMENGKWSKPKNIGHPINTKEDEIGVFVSIDGALAYYSSRFGGDWNIYSFELYEEARPKPVTMVKGELTDDNGAPVKDATIEIAYVNSDQVDIVKVNGDDGKFAAIVRTGEPQDVMVTVKKEGNAFDSKLISKEEITKSITLRGNDLSVRPLKEGQAYTINDILYATSSYNLTPKSKFILKQFARFLTENPTIQITIQGHTDDLGDDAENMKLSQDRSEEVKRFLVSQGVAEARLIAEGYGETRPKVANENAAQRAVNRRTDFMIRKL